MRGCRQVLADVSSTSSFKEWFVLDDKWRQKLILVGKVAGDSLSVPTSIYYALMKFSGRIGVRLQSGKLIVLRFHVLEQ